MAMPAPIPNPPHPPYLLLNPLQKAIRHVSRPLPPVLDDPADGFARSCALALRSYGGLESNIVFVDGLVLLDGVAPEFPGDFGFAAGGGDVIDLGWGGVGS